MMTPTEFKIKYPHLSHLDGPDLWDAMEDDYIREHANDKKEEVTDWKGNIIKAGDEICLVKIKDKRVFGNMGMMIPGQGIVWSTEEPELDRNCWEVGEYQKVDEKLCITIEHGEYTLTQPISICMRFIDTSCVILAIKGVSDVEPDNI